MRRVVETCVGLTLSMPVTSGAITELTNLLPTLSGNLRTTNIATQKYHQELLWDINNYAQGQSDLSLRIVADSQPAPDMHWEVQLVQKLTFRKFETPASLRGYSIDTSRKDEPYRLISTPWKWGLSNTITTSIDVDRANAKISAGRTDITVGRQAISFGKAYFWNPLDIFRPFSSIEFNRDYKSGVDAVRVDAEVGNLSGFTAIGMVGQIHDKRNKDLSLWYRSVSMGRFFTNLLNWDVALQIGKILDGYQFGSAFAGEVGTIEVRSEAAWVFMHDNKTKTARSFPAANDHLDMVIGIGKNIEGGVLQLQLEYYYNGAASGPKTDRFSLIAAGQLQHVNRHLLGTLTRYQLTPLLHGSLAFLWGVEDASWLFQPGLVYSATSTLDLVTGAAIMHGRRPEGTTLEDFQFHSEFGTYPNYYYVETKFYF